MRDAFQERIPTLADSYRLSGDDMMCLALKWKDDHPVSFMAIENAARDMVRDHRHGRLQVLIYNVADAEGFTPPDKTLTAAFQRILMQRVPGYLDSFTISKSRADDAS